MANESENLAERLASGEHLNPRGRPQLPNEKRDAYANNLLADREIQSVINANERLRESIALLNGQLFDAQRRLRDVRQKLLREANAESVAAARAVEVSRESNNPQS